MKIVTHNVDDPISFKDGLYGRAFPELSFENRWTKLQILYSHHIRDGVKVFALQEVGQDIALGAIRQFFEQECHFICIITPYNRSSQSYVFILAYDPTVLHVQEGVQIFFTRSGLPIPDGRRQTMSTKDLLDHNYGVIYERSAQVANVVVIENGKTFTVVNTHPGLLNEHRLAAMHVLCTALDGIQNVVLLGDFNQFDATRCCNEPFYEQQRVIQAHGFSNTHSTPLYTKGLKATFVSHPYDIARFLSKEEKARMDKQSPANIRARCLREVSRGTFEYVSMVLDDVYVRGPDIHIPMESIAPWTILNTTLINTLDGTTRAAFNTQYRIDILDGRSPALPSDHISIQFEIMF
jgi:endonuclease/exonuclease/phosphatase family metal-dependent hydrolase